VALFTNAIAALIYLAPLGVAGVFLARLLQGFGEACLYTGAAAWIVETAGIHRSARALGFMSSGICGGISAGPMMGQWLGSFERAAMLQMAAALAGLAIVWRVSEDYQPGIHPAGRLCVPWSLAGCGKRRPSLGL